jgi:phosphoglycolate phosphatase
MTQRSADARPLGIFFDLDGTLVDSRTDLAMAANEVRRSQGLSALDPAVVVSYVGDGVQALLARVLAHQDDPGRPPLPPGEVELAAAHAVFRGHYGVHLLDNTVFYPGVAAMLETLADRTLVVVTNKPREFTLPILEGLGVAASIDAVIAGDDVVSRKPHPEHLQAALDAVGLPAHRCVMVGDSPNDVLPARALGVTSVAVTWGLTPAGRLQEAGPDVMVDTAGELLAVL